MSIIIQIPIKGIENIKQKDKTKDYSLGTEGVFEIELSEDTNIYFIKSGGQNGVGVKLWNTIKKIACLVETDNDKSHLEKTEGKGRTLDIGFCQSCV